MAKDFLRHSSLPLFLKELAAYGDVHGPVMTDDTVPAFGRIDSPADLRLDNRRALIPPKKYLLPPRETVLTFSPDRGYRHPPVSERKIILFGLHPCDLAGISYLDKVFTATEPDPLYLKRRRNLILVGLSCEPDDYCFCGDMGTGEPSQFDIFLHCTVEGYRLAGGSPQGEQIISGISMLLSECELLPHSRQACLIERKILDAAACNETFPDSPLWDDFAARCLSCGACSLCCPTCYCFDIREYGSLDGETAKRLREWDNCLFTEHGKVAGGFNFRNNRRARFLYRYQHKYLGFGPVRGIVACVGCGRCREVCPVRIDLLDLFREGGHEQQSCN
jgi:sulfhydrogenase subunit beta (sulfur reductase)